jgi:hypothetical protein
MVNSRAKSTSSISMGKASAHQSSIFGGEVVAEN